MLTVQVYIQPRDIEEFYKENKVRLRTEMVTVASNDTTGYSIHLTDINDEPHLLVCFDGEVQEDKTLPMNDFYIEYYAEMIYEEYLYSFQDTTTFKDDDDVYIRQDELSLATSDYLQTLLCTKDVESEYGVDMVDTFLESVGHLLYKNFNISMYHPVFVVNAQEESEVLLEYPYETD